MAQSSFSFRISAEGLEELRAKLTALGRDGQAAFDQIRNASPQLADAMAKAEQATDRARARMEQLGANGRIFAGLDEATVRVNERVSRLANHIDNAAGSLRTFANDNVQVSAALNLTSGLVDSFATGMSALSAAISASPIGRIIAVVGVGIAVWQGATAAIGAYQRATEQANIGTVRYADATERLNELLGRTAALERDRARALDSAALQVATDRIRAAETALAGLNAQLERNQQQAQSPDLEVARRARQSVGATPLGDRQARRLREDIERATGAVALARREYLQAAEALDVMRIATAAQLGPLTSMSAAVDALRDRLNPGIEAIRLFAAQQAVLRRALGDGLISREEHDRLISALAAIADAAQNPAATGGGGRDAVADLERQNALASELLERVQNGTVALRDLDREREIANRLQQEGLTLDSERGQRLAAAIEDQANLAEQLERTRQAQQDAAQVIRDSLTPQERYAEQIQRLNDLLPEIVRQTGDQARAQQIVNEAIRRADPAFQEYQQQIERYQRAAEQPFLEAVRSIQRAFGDLFGRIFTDGVKSFSDLGDQVKRIMLKAVGDILSAEVVGPLIGQGMAALGFQNAAARLGYLMPSAPGGGAAAGGSSGGLGGLQNFPIGSLLGNSGIGSGWLNGASTWLNNSIGVPLGFAPAGSLAPGVYGPLAAGQIYGTTLTSALGYGLPIVGATLPGLISGNYAQAGFGFGGAALGAVVGGPVGAAIGGFLGNLVGGLFGKRPSAPPTSFAGIGFDLGAGGILSETWRRGGSESNRRVPDFGPAGQAMRVVEDALKQIQSAVGASITGGRYTQGSLNYYTVGDTQSYVSYLNDGRGGSVALPSAEAAVRDFLSRLVPGLSFDSSAGRAQLYTIANRGADKLEDLLAALGQAKNFQDTFDALTGTAEAASQVAQQMKALDEQLKGLRSAAADYGYSLDEVAQAEATARARMRDSYNESVQDQILALTDPAAAALKAWQKERDQAVKDAAQVGADIVEVERLYALKREAVIRQSVGNLQAWLDGQVFGAASSSSPQSRFAAAQEQFAQQLGLARGGDGAALGSITGYADRLLAAGRGVYATTVDFATLESFVRQTISGLGRDLGLPGFASGGSFTVGGAGGTDSQIVRFRATPGETVTIAPPGQGDGAVIAELRAMRVAMDALVRENMLLRGVLRQQPRAS